MTRPVERLSKRQREATPLPFAIYLINRVKLLVPCERIAVLFAQLDGVYSELIPEVDLWDVTRNAHNYNGPYPIIAHPPCGPWGRYSAVCNDSREHGIVAMQLVHKFGGVVEQPLGSTLYREHGRRGLVEMVCQGDYGHAARKATLLYLHKGEKRMANDQWQCQRCGTPLQGQSVLCIKCYRECTVPCGACTFRDARGRVTVRRNKHKQFVDCNCCNNERFVLLWPEGE